MRQKTYHVKSLSTIATVHPNQLSLQLNNNNNVSNANNSIKKPIRLYKERWLLAVVVSILQIISSIMWISYPPVANIAASYYNVSLSAINWLTEISFVIYVVFVFPAMWLMKTYGIKHVVYATSGCSVVGAAIRLFGNFEFVPENYRFPITMLGQTIISITFPLLMTLPTQVSQSWFPDEHRALSTSITSMTTYVGGLIGILLPPYLSHSPSELYIMNDSFCVTTIILGSLGFLIRRSQPPTPPYAVSAIKLQEISAQTTTQNSFTEDIKIILKSRHAMLLALAGGGVFGALPVIYLTLSQQLLCPSGYSNEFVAICGALVQGAGFIFSPVISYVIGRTKLFKEMVKISLALTLLLAIALTLIMRIQNMEIAIAVVAILLGITTLGATPPCMELGVETCYPVNEGMSGTMYWISSQIQAAVLVPLMTHFAQPLTTKQYQHQTCTVGNSDEAYDLTYPTLVVLGIFTIEVIAVFIWCHPKYKRMEAEKPTTQPLPIPKFKPLTEDIMPTQRY